MKSITQDMKYRQSLVNFALKYGVSRASRKYNKARSYIYFWLKRYDGTIKSLATQSRRPHHHPNEHTQEEIKLVKNMRRRNPKLGIIELWCRLRDRGYTRTPESLYRCMRRLGLFKPIKSKKKRVSKPYEQMTRPGERVQVDIKFVPSSCLVGEAKGQHFYQYTAIDEFSRLRYLEAFEEKSTYSSMVFLENAVRFYKKHGLDVSCVQTDNGLEFTNRFAHSKKVGMPTLFESRLASLGIRHKLIRPFTPRHNGKVERSHREDQKRFYSSHTFYSFRDFTYQLCLHHLRSNKIPMRPLRWMSPIQFLRSYTVQYV